MMKFKNDNNREYISYAFKEFWAKTRIKYETNTPSYYPKQNDKVISQDNKTIIKSVSNMLHSQSLISIFGQRQYKKIYMFSIKLSI